MDQPPPPSEIPATNGWKSNAELIVDVARLYFLPEDRVLDATYGLHGGFWKKVRPAGLVTNDLNPLADTDHHQDYTKLPEEWGEAFDVVVFDPEYKLSGTPALGDFDVRYGIAEPARWQDRLQKILDGAEECGRVTRRLLLVKIQDQICSGRAVWMTDLVTERLAPGFQKVDRFDLVRPVRPQPPGRRQVHARRNSSQLLVFRKKA